MKRISVIIPVFNALHETKSCIKSVLKNFDFNFGDVLIIDDCSNSKTEKYLKNIVKKYPHKLSLIRNNENLGYLKSCNLAVSKADAEIVVLLNSDTEIPAGFADKIIKCFDSDLDIITASPIASNSANYYIPQILPLNIMNKIISSRMPTYPEILNSEGFCFCIRKSFIDTHGLFDTIYDKGYYEEIDFCFRVRQDNKKCVLIDNLYVKHKRNKSFGSLRNNLMDKNQKIFYAKWHQQISENEINPIKVQIQDIIRASFGIYSIFPRNILKIRNILTEHNRLETLKNLSVKITPNNNSSKIIYTCVSGLCDFIPIIQTYYAKDWRYVCFTNNKKLLRFKQLGMWEIRPMQFSQLDNTQNARWHKTHPHILFPDAKESIWLDANLDILTNYLFEIINNTNKNILIPKHYCRDCIFDEIQAVKAIKKETEENLNKIKTYLDENNMPRNYGLNETNIIYRKHNNPQIIKLMDDWWYMIENYTKRDQASLSFVLRKNHIKPDEICFDNARIDRKNFKIYSHNLPNTFIGKILKTIFY